MEPIRALTSGRPARLEFGPDVPTRAAEIFRTAAKNARFREIHWSLTGRDCARLWKRADGCCELTGLEFDLGPPTARGKRRPFAPSLDRIDSSRGYTIANVRLVSVVGNLALNEWGLDPVITFARALCGQADLAAAQQMDMALAKWRAAPVDVRPPGWLTIRERWPDLHGPELGRKTSAARELAYRLGIARERTEVDTGKVRAAGMRITRYEYVYPAAMLDELEARPA